MGKKKNKKKKQTEEEKEEAVEEEDDAEFIQMLKDFKQDDIEQGRHAEAPPPAASVRTHTHINTHTCARIHEAQAAQGWLCRHLAATRSRCHRAKLSH